MDKAKGQKKQSIENELMTDVDLISNPAVKAFIQKKKLAKAELTRFRQTGGERGLAARKARGIHGKLDLESASDDEVMDVNSSEEEEEPVKQKAKVIAKAKAPKK